MTTPGQLAALGKNALAWARTYTALVEALVQEGVPEEIARDEARKVATVAALTEHHDVDGPCPLCGRG